MDDSGHINCVGLLKDGQHYIFLYTDENVSRLCYRMARLALRSDLNFSVQDAIAVSDRIREGLQEAHLLERK